MVVNKTEYLEYSINLKTNCLSHVFVWIGESETNMLFKEKYSLTIMILNK